MQIGWFQRAFRLPKPLTLIRLQDKAAVVRGRFSQFRFSRQKETGMQQNIAHALQREEKASCYRTIRNSISCKRCLADYIRS